MKTYFISVLIPYMLLHFSGCYSMQKVTKEELSPTPDYPKLSVITDEREFTFNQGDYSFKNDTIYGFGKSTLLENFYQPFEGKISINDVEKFETVKMYAPLDTGNVFLKTKEKEYVFKYEKNFYSVQNDTIYGKGKFRLINNVEEPFDSCLGLADVKEIKMEEFNVVGTTLIVAGIVLIISALIVNAAMGDYGIDF